MASPARRPGSTRAVVALTGALVALVAAAGVAISAARATLHLLPDPPARVATTLPGAPPAAANSPAIARNPQRSGSLVVVNRTDQPGFGAGLAWSDDDGASWGHTVLPLPRGLDRPYEPDIAFAPDGTLYAAYTNLHGAGNTPDHLWLSRSTDGGRSLSPPTLAAGPLAFQPRLAVGGDGTIYVTWLQGVGVGQLSLTGASPVMAAASGDGGHTISTPVQVSDPSRVRVGAAAPVVASDGSLVVLYEDFGGDVRDFQNLDGPVWTEPFALVITRSTDGAESFEPGREIDSGVVPVERFIPYRPTFPSLAAGPDGALVATWSDGRYGDPDVLLRRSTDLGSSWSGPSRLNGGPASAGVQRRLPTVAIAPDGRTDILYLDNRRHPAEGLVDAYAGSSTDGGRSFVETRLSATSFDPGVGATVISGHVPPSLGARLGLASEEERTAATWTDTSRGVPATGRQDVVVSRVIVAGRSTAAARLVAAALGSIALIAVAAALAALRPATAVAVRRRTWGWASHVGRHWPGAGPATPPLPPVVSSRHLRLAGRAYPLVLPRLRDPRLHVAACLLTVQVLGQTSLEFQLSVAQILLSLGVCAVLEIGVTFAQRRAFIWPASALLTGNGVALLLRVPGTHHGDWWSTRGGGIFLFAAVFSLLSKYVLRVRGRHIFNPSNIGLVVCFVVFGTARVDPQDLWFGPMSVGLALTYAIITGGGLLIVRRLKMLALTGTFFLAFATFIGVIAAAGHCVTARWSVGPVCGGYYWSTVVFSPEILIFMFFMITDPQTTPRGQVARVVYGFSVAFLGALMAAPLQTEFATKVAILGGLVAVCMAQPLMLRFLPAPGSPRDRIGTWLSVRPPTGPRARTAAGTRILIPGIAVLVIMAVCAGMVTAAGIPARRTGGNGADPAALGAQVAGRPVIALDPAAVPAAQIAPDARASDGSLTVTRAQSISHDVVEDLAIQSEAVKSLDPRLAATAAYGPWLQGVLRDIRTGRRAGQRTVPHYHLHGIRLVLSSNPGDYQASKEIAVEVRGTVDREVLAGRSGDQVVSRTETAFQRTLALQHAGNHYLIAADYTAT